jgi:hypothetical protein
MRHCIAYWTVTDIFGKYSGSILHLEDEGRRVSQKHGIIFQKIVVIITSARRTAFCLLITTHLINKLPPWQFYTAKAINQFTALFHELINRMGQW